MTIINHGSWVRYVPDVWPEGLPPNIMFCKRESDGVDWYDFMQGDAMAAGSIKATVYNGKVGAATRDITLLFPQAAVLLEITDDDVADPQAFYGGLMYDPVANTLTVPPPIVPPFVSPKQARLALLAAGLLDQVEAAVAAEGRATQITWEYATEVNRTDPLIATLGQSLGLTDEAIDQLFRDASQIP
ncbi:MULTISPECIES: hypothetical protein [unclassified Bradyrhizobium]|uniref:hypothetical protein n=1 Tax=unclassified Bradyrhizobium TaxID=2631580 RepID=UPI002FEF03E4